MENFNNNLTADYVRSMLFYDPYTGVFTWKEGRRKNKKAGCLDGYGYVVIKLNKKNYKAHRLAFLWVTGFWPRHRLDHKDGDNSNNTFSNLRLCSHAENLRNRKMSKNNKSGFKGIYWNKHSKKYRAQIQMYGKCICLGYFDTKEEAALAYNKAAIEYFGEFARLNEIPNGSKDKD